MSTTYMKKSLPVIISLAVIIILGLALPSSTQAFNFGFVDQANYTASTPAGLFDGLWHGMLAPYSLVARLLSVFSSNLSVAMYAFNNTGWFYDLGFLVGATMLQPIGWLAGIVAFILAFV